MDLLNTIFTTNEKNKPVFLLALTPYICLVTNEAYDWCLRDNRTLSKFCSKNTLEKIRAKGKLFSNDKFLSYKEQVRKFENIILIEHKYFKSLTTSFWPDFLINDVGTYKDGNHYIGNTIQYVYDFNDFATKDKSIYESGQAIKNFTTEIGATLQEIITLLTGKSYQIKSSNLCSDKYDHVDFNFARTFKQIDELIIFSLRCRINFLLFSFKKQCPQNSMLYLRMIYLTFYSLKSDLDNLKICYNAIFDDYYEKNFRNCMAHYSLYKKIDESDIMSEVVGYGLIEKYFNMGYNDLVNIIEEKLVAILHELVKNMNVTI